MTGERALSEEPFSVVQNDVRMNTDALREQQSALLPQGWELTLLRVHDILVWTELEKSGYYRS